MNLPGWQLVRAVLAQSLPVVVTLTGLAIQSAHATTPCTDPAERFVRVGETVTMCIPRPWIDTVVGSENEGAILLFGLWPRLGGFYDGQEQARPNTGLDHGGTVQVLLHLSDRINPLQERYEINRRMFSPNSRHEPTMGLEHWGKDTPPTKIFETKMEIYFTVNSDG